MTATTLKIVMAAMTAPSIGKQRKIRPLQRLHLFVVLLVAHAPTAAVALTKPGEKTQNSIMTSALSPEKAGCAAPEAGHAISWFAPTQQTAKTTSRKFGS
jgi:hypothetical protein